MVDYSDEQIISYGLEENPYVLAPMAGVTDKAMRRLCREFGCGLVYTEMVSAKALTYRNEKTFKLMDPRDEAQPMITQLFGSEGDIMAEGARLAVADGATALDINMGCPVPKVAGHGEGSALLKDFDQAVAIAKAVVEAVEVPVSVKMRIGWETVDPEIPQLAQALEEVGIKMIAVHGRTRSQYYSGKANWDAIRDVVEAVHIPVLANGDVFSLEDARAIRAYTGAAGVMIGRGALGQPWLFRALQSGNEEDMKVDMTERTAILRRHAQLMVDYDGERIGMQKMRKHFGWYFKGVPHGGKLRQQGMALSNIADLDKLIADIVK